METPRSVQAKRGLSSDGIANDGGNFIDAPVQPIRQACQSMNLARGAIIHF